MIRFLRRADPAAIAIWAVATVLAAAILSASALGQAVYLEPSPDSPFASEAGTAAFVARIDGFAAAKSALVAIDRLRDAVGPWAFVEGDGETSAVARGGAKLEVSVRTSSASPRLPTGVRVFLDGDVPVVSVPMRRPSDCTVVLGHVATDAFVGGKVEARIDLRDERIPRRTPWLPFARLPQGDVWDRSSTERDVGAICAFAAGPASRPGGDRLWLRVADPRRGTSLATR